MPDDIDRYKDGAVTHPDDPVQGFDDWVSDEAMAAMVSERAVYPERSTPDVAKKVFDRNAPVAAQAIVHIALHSKSEAQRLRAAQYVVDRSLGKIGDERTVEGNDPLTGMFQEISAYVDQHEAGQIPSITDLPPQD